MAETLGRVALEELRRLLPTPCPVCGGRRWFAELSSGFGCCSVPVPALDDSAGQDAAARHWLASYEPSAPGAVSKLLDAAPALLSIAERVAAMDPALLDRLAARYAPGPVHCRRCRREMVGVLTVTDDRVRHWHCPSEREPWHGLTGGRVTPLPDDDVLALLAAIRGEAVPDAE